MGDQDRPTGRAPLPPYGDWPKAGHWDNLRLIATVIRHGVRLWLARTLPRWTGWWRP